MNHISRSVGDTADMAKSFVETLIPRTDRATVVCLSGDLGAGKTAFTQAIARVFGVTETVASPTFVIEKIYALDGQAFTHLVHIDAYRLGSSTELAHLGWQNILSDPHNIIVIEWPERVEDILPDDCIWISFKTLGENEREISVMKS